MRRVTSADILGWLGLASVPTGSIRTLDEIFAAEDVQRRGLQLRVEHEQLGQVSVPADPWRIDCAPASGRLPRQSWASTPVRSSKTSGSK